MSRFFEKRKKPLLLAPGGTGEMAVASLDAGADMVYMGPKGWSRRTRAFEAEDHVIGQVSRYARSRGKVLKLALNTLPASHEIPMGLASVDRFVEMGVLDFIMVDPGFARLVKQRHPQARITASVGCSVMNLPEFNFYHRVGFDVIVAPSELTLSELARIRENFTGGIEVLIHANRDYTYLGRCTMSSYFKFRHLMDDEGKDHFFGSPNRGGLCYRVCRSRWEGTCAGEPFSGKLGNEFYMSVDEIPGYVGMGIDVLKVQGREYSPGLIQEMVGFYREYIDALYEDPRCVENNLWHRRSRELARMRDEERGRRTGALLDECSGRGPMIFACDNSIEPSGDNSRQLSAW